MSSCANFRRSLANKLTLGGTGQATWKAHSGVYLDICAEVADAGYKGFALLKTE